MSILNSFRNEWENIPDFHCHPADFANMGQVRLPWIYIFSIHDIFLKMMFVMCFIVWREKKDYILYIFIKYYFNKLKAIYYK